MKHIIPQYVLLNIYNALILPHLSYGILAWGKNNNIKAILKIQKKTVRAISKSSYNSHTDPLFKRLKLLKVNDIRKYFEIKFYHKYSNNILPEYFNDFARNNEYYYSGRSTRSRYRLSVPVHRHCFCKSGLRWSLVETINSCPDSILNKMLTHSIKAVSQQYKSFLFEEYQEACTIQNCYVCNRQ